MCFRVTSARAVLLVQLGRLAMDYPVPRSLLMPTFALHKLTFWMFAHLNLHLMSDFQQVQARCCS